MTTGYSKAQITLHWLVVVLLATQFFFAEGMGEAFEGREAEGSAAEAREAYGEAEETETEEAAEEYAEAEEARTVAATGAGIPSGALIHMILGASLFGLMGLRLAIRVGRGAPPAPEPDPVWQKRLARANHGLFYVLLLGMPVFGAIAWFGPSETIAEAHEFAAKVLVAAVALHVAGAVYGQAVQKTGVLERMLRAPEKETGGA